MRLRTVGQDPGGSAASAERPVRQNACPLGGGTYRAKRRRLGGLLAFLAGGKLRGHPDGVTREVAPELLPRLPVIVNNRIPPVLLVVRHHTQLVA